MSCARHSSTLDLKLAAALLLAVSAPGITAAGQGGEAALPSECSAYASVPLPAEADHVPVPRTYPACASYRSYRGIGRPANYAEARACAWKERLAQKANLGQNQDEPAAWVVGGSLILADIYLNGAGVRRNIPLSIRLACEEEEGMAKLALADIRKLDGSTSPRRPFEFCDYAFTTFSMNFCSVYEFEKENDPRSRYYDRLRASMTPQQKMAFERLLAAQSAYVSKHALEVYQGGTIRTMRTLGSQSILDDLFHTEVVHFERKHWPALSENQLKASDAMVQRQYKSTLRRLETQKKEDIDDGAVTADHLAEVEGKWEIYRDAWGDFARLRYPLAVAAIRAEINFRRYFLLKTIV